MGKFEFKSQICTTLEQSERLFKLGLKKETADMVYQAIGTTPYNVWDKQEIKDDFYPAWSLHRLVILLPVEVTFYGYKFQLRKDVLSKIDDIDNVYDEVIGVIQRAIELDCFNKDYLEERK